MFALLEICGVSESVESGVEMVWVERGKPWKKPIEGDLRGWKMTYDPWKTTTFKQNSALLKGRCFLII